MAFQNLLPAFQAGHAGSIPVARAFADLVPVREGLVVQAVASVLRVAERPRQPLEPAVLEHLARRRMLLVLDNCEHVLAEAATTPPGPLP